MRCQQAGRPGRAERPSMGRSTRCAIHASPRFPFAIGRRNPFPLHHVSRGAALTPSAAADPTTNPLCSVRSRRATLRHRASPFPSPAPYAPRARSPNVLSVAGAGLAHPRNALVSARPNARHRGKGGCWDTASVGVDAECGRLAPCLCHSGIDGETNGADHGDGVSAQVVVEGHIDVGPDRPRRFGVLTVSGFVDFQQPRAGW